MRARLAALATLALGLTAAYAVGQEQNVVSYRLGLGGSFLQIPPLPPPPDPIPLVTEEFKYVHGNETPGEVFNRLETPTIRWDAIVQVEGPNFGGANLVINLAVRAGAADGPLVTAAAFGGDSCEGCPPVQANFSIGISVREGEYGTITWSALRGGANLSFSNPGLTYPGELRGMGAGYINWNSPSSNVPGVGRITLPDGTPGLGHHPAFDGKIDISNLPNGTYYLVLTQGIINVLRDDLDLNQRQGSFVKRARVTPDAHISFVVTDGTDPPPDDDPGNNGGGGDGGDGDDEGDGGQDDGDGEVEFPDEIEGAEAADPEIQDPGPNPYEGEQYPAGELHPGQNDDSITDGGGINPQMSVDEASANAAPPFCFCACGVAEAALLCSVLLCVIPRRGHRHGRPYR